MNSEHHLISASVPSPPFWGPKVIELPLAQVFSHLNLPALFRIGWGAGKASGAKWSQIQQKFTDRLAAMQASLLQENWLQPKAAYGYWPCTAAPDALHIQPVREQRGASPLSLPLPRQPFPPHRSLCDYYQPADGSQKDLIVFQMVSMGEMAVTKVRQLQEVEDLVEVFFLHGLLTQLTEAAAQYMLSAIRTELGIENNRGKRYSWGYEPLPDLSQQVSIMRLLDPQNTMQVFFTSAYQFIPEYATAALFVHHPGAEYFRMTSKEPYET